MRRPTFEMFVAKAQTLNERHPLPYQIRALDTDMKKLFTSINGRLRFGDGTDGERGENISGEFQVVADSGSANTEFSITHTLGAIPIGYLVTKISNAGVIYDSGTTWTSSTIYLKSSAANSAVTVFLLK